MLGDPFVRDFWSAVSRTWHRLLVSSIPAMALMFRASRSRAFQSRAFQPRALLSRVALTGLVVTGAILAGSVLAACGDSQKVETPAEYEAWLKTQNEGKPDQPKGADEYIIGAGDSLSVFVWHNADLSEGGVQVRPDGRISVPLINEIDAAGKTPPQLAAEIEERLKKYVQDPLVSVIVRSFVGPLDRQIRVIGEATDPQSIPYRDGMTVLDLMIATKGLTKYAAGNRAILVRHGPDGKTHNIGLHLDDLIKNGDITQNVALQPGDTLIIPQSWF